MFSTIFQAHLSRTTLYIKFQNPGQSQNLQNDPYQNDRLNSPSFLTGLNITASDAVLKYFNKATNNYQEELDIEAVNLLGSDGKGIDRDPDRSLDSIVIKTVGSEDSFMSC